MESRPSENMAMCASQLDAIHRQHAVSRGVGGLLILGAAVFAGVQTGHHWIGVIGIVLAALIVVVPRLRRSHRLLAQWACPACHQDVGSWLTRESRIYLRCQHCGQETATDCVTPYAGGPPQKA